MSLIRNALLSSAFSFAFPLAPIWFFWLLVCYATHPPVVIRFSQQEVFQGSQQH